MENIGTPRPQATKPPWQQIIAPYRGADVRQSSWQIATSFLPYGAVWYVMYLSLAYSYWITLGLAVLAG